MLQIHELLICGYTISCEQQCPLRKKTATVVLLMISCQISLNRINQITFRQYNLYNTLATEIAYGQAHLILPCDE